jgi:hypothetical protein
MIRKDFLKPSDCWCRKAYGVRTTKTVDRLTETQVAVIKAVLRGIAQLKFVGKQLAEPARQKSLTGKLLS